MLLGLPFLNKLGPSAHLASDMFTVSGEMIRMNFGTTEGPEVNIATVQIANKITKSL